MTARLDGATARGSARGPCSPPQVWQPAAADSASGTASFGGTAAQGSGDSSNSGLSMTPRRPKAAKAARGSAGKSSGRKQGGHGVICQVSGCCTELSNQPRYYWRYRICRQHSGVPAIQIDGRQQRFCQACGRFQDLSEFEGTKKSCRRKLAIHNQRRRVTLAASYPPSPARTPPAPTPPTPPPPRALSSPSSGREEEAEASCEVNAPPSPQQLARQPSAAERLGLSPVGSLDLPPPPQPRAFPPAHSQPNPCLPRGEALLSVEAMGSSTLAAACPSGPSVGASAPARSTQQHGGMPTLPNGAALAGLEGGRPQQAGPEEQQGGGFDDVLSLLPALDLPWGHCHDEELHWGPEPSLQQLPLLTEPSGRWLPTMDSEALLPTMPQAAPAAPAPMPALLQPQQHPQVQGATLWSHSPASMQAPAPFAGAFVGDACGNGGSSLSAAFNYCWPVPQFPLPVSLAHMQGMQDMPW